MRDFWYYHKYHVLIGIGIFLIGIYYLAEILGKREPDYELALVCGQTVSDEFCVSLEEGLKPYLTDVNGDGKVIVRVNSYYYGGETGFREERDASRLMGGAVQLAADLELGISGVYLTDNVELLSVGTDGGFQDTWIAWRDSRLLRGLDMPEMVNDSLTTEELTDRLVIGIRSGEKCQTKDRELWNCINH